MLVQTFPSWRDRVPVTLFFVFDLASHPGLRDARDYRGRADLFRLSEAARRFNELPDERRHALYAEMLKLSRDRSWMELPPAVREMFPVENRVDDRTVLMRSSL